MLKAIINSQSEGDSCRNAGADGAKRRKHGKEVASSPGLADWHAHHGRLFDSSPIILAAAKNSGLAGGEHRLIEDEENCLNSFFAGMLVSFDLANARADDREGF